MPIMFRFIIPFYNPGDYLHTCLSTIRMQSVQNWTAHLYDDLSTDHSPKIAEQYCASDDRFRLVTNRVKHHQSGNLFQFAREAQFAKSDVGVQVDGDDWLPDAHVLARLDRAYSEHPLLLMTFGSFIRQQGGQRTTIGFASEPESYERVRQVPWRTTHLKTHRIGLLKRVRENSILDDDGSRIRYAGDMATSFPMIEMAGGAHSLFLDQVNLVHNKDTPLTVGKNHREEQARYETLSRSRTPYPPLTDDEVRSIVEGT